MTDSSADLNLMPKILKPTNVFYNVLKNYSQANSQSSLMFGTNSSSNDSVKYTNSHESQKPQDMLFYTARRYRSRKSLISDRIYHQRRYMPRYRLPFINPEYTIRNINDESKKHNSLNKTEAKNLISKMPSSDITQDISIIREENIPTSNDETSSLLHKMDESSSNNKLDTQYTQIKLKDNEDITMEENNLIIDKNVLKRNRASKVGDIKLRFSGTLEALRRMELASQMLERQKIKLDARKSEMEKSLKRLRMIYKFVKNMEKSGKSIEQEEQEMQDLNFELPKNQYDDELIVEKVEEFYSKAKNLSTKTANNDNMRIQLNSNMHQAFPDNPISNNLLKIGTTNLERAHEVCYRLELPIFEGLPPMPAHQSPVDLSACTYLVLKQI